MPKAVRASKNIWKLLPAADRPRLLTELLASELALRRLQDEVCDQAEYAERFPEYLGVMAEVFRRRRPEPVQETAATGEKYLEIIQAVRSRLRPDASTTAILGSDRNLRLLASQLSRHALQDPPSVDAPGEQQLWLSIMQTCRKLKSLDPQGVEAVVRDLLESFPPARRSVLIDLLLGHTSSQAARAGGVTERTVTSTILIATKLLEQAS